jgi:hypothetical protein
MIDPVSLQMLRDVVAIFGVIAGFTYYVMTVRHQRSSRKAQLFMEMYRDFKTVDVQKAWIDVVIVWEWDNYEDFRKKYSWTTNWEERKKQALLTGIYEGLGVLVYRNLIDIKMIDELMRSYIVLFWEKMSPIFLELRKMNPLTAEWTEYLYNEVKKIESVPAYTLNKP